MFFNCSNVKYQFESRTGVIRSKNQAFIYESQGKSDTLTVFSDKLDTGLPFRRVAVDVTISIAAPIRV